MTRPLWEIDAEIQRLKAEQKKARGRTFKPGMKLRSWKPTGEGQRRPREHDRGYLAYLRRQPCRVGLVAGRCAGPIQAAHLRYGDAVHGRVNPGLQQKPHDHWATSLCARHHAEQHARGDERAWWAGYGLDGSEQALNQHGMYLEGRDAA